MSNKPPNKLLDADRLIRELFPVSPSNAPTTKIVTLATIEVIGGFEAFNTRPYHNYEDWGQGYRITARGITVEAEDLDDALIKWQQAARPVSCRDSGRANPRTIP